MRSLLWRRSQLSEPIRHPFKAHNNHLNQRQRQSKICRCFSSDPIQTPIAIVGGGPSGLLLSLILSRYQVPSVLLESQSVDERCSHPQAHFLNTRSMEILRQFPRIYDRVQAEMMPVQQWNHFQFGYNMLPETALARVLHPVDRPLKASNKVDANGVLVDDNLQNNNNGGHDHPDARSLSACSVGHLAQHTFCRILYDAAQAEALSETKTQLLYNTRVQELEETGDGKFALHTTNGGTIYGDICVAADGAHSLCRSQWDIELRGKVGIQHLLNIHVKTCPDWAWKHLHQNGQNFAMLYSVFHPNIVAMIVCHSVGEYVFQVPFFQPYQDLSDYNQERVEGMVRDAMGISDDSTHDNTSSSNDDSSKLEIVSVKAWTMSSLIADQYYHQSGTMKSTGFLIGDAAHVFPPAGGLGMNTGMQDVYSLAWKLAWAHHNRKLRDKDVMRKLGQSYTHERRPVAQDNAALSVRNYQRLLGVTKACYLYDQHPTLLIKGLETSSPLLPFAARRQIFNRLFDTATWTLSSLRDMHHPYTKHVQSNIRNILASGGGLPLLFPKAELGFGYYCSDEHLKTTVQDLSEDTLGFTPQIRTGYLFPHVEATIQSGSQLLLLEQEYPQLKPLGDKKSSTVTISTSDLPAQLSRDSKPCFVVLWITDDEEEQLQSVAENVSKKVTKAVGLQVKIVKLSTTTAITNNAMTSSNHPNVLVLTEKYHPIDGSLAEQYCPSIWLIRPDGHVAGGITADETAKELCMETTFPLLGLPQVTS